MKKIPYITIVALLCLSASLWFGCKEKELPGSINGCITDKATGEPIKTAGVELMPIGLKTITGSEGQYEFNEIDPGTYKLHITKTGYEELVSNEIVVNSNKATKSDVQIEKLPPSLRIVNDKSEDISSLDFGAGEDDVMRSFNIFNDGTQTLQWQITTAADWIAKVSMENGTLSPGAIQTIIITIDRSKLKEGDNVTTMHITSNDGSGQLQLKAKGWSLPFLNTLEVTDIQKGTAILNGQITNAGQPSYTERGFVYSTSSLPTEENTIRKLTVAVNNNPTFSATVTDLEDGAGYYVRAYAINKKGIAYSANEVYFKYDASLEHVYIMESLNLMIQKNDIPGGYYSWNTANSKCRTSQVGGYSDWRLPSIAELKAICARRTTIGGFTEEEEYWTAYAYYKESGYHTGWYYTYVIMGACTAREFWTENAGNEAPCKVRAVRTITE